MKTPAILTVCVAMAAAALGGCAVQPYMTEARLNRGLVLVYTGIEGRSPFNRLICQGLVRGGVPYAIHRLDWTVGVPGAYLMNLRYEKRNRQTAAEIADKVRNYRRMHPGRPVILLGQSGGAAMAAWTAEALGPEEPVDGVILLAAALSPEYPIGKALAASRRGIVSFYSAGDVLFLGMGTTLSGAMDGRYGSSAGRVGFKAPGAEEGAKWPPRFYQVPWSPSMTKVGHWGGHTSTSARGFVRDYIAPLVIAETWDEPFMQRVARGVGGAPAKVEQPAAGFHRF